MNLRNERPLIPLNVDPPNHSKYRKLLDPLFARKRMDEQEEDITRRVNALIDAFIDRGECNFTDEFAELFPTSVFLGLMGLPEDELPMFLELRDGILHPEKIDPGAHPPVRVVLPRPTKSSGSEARRLGHRGEVPRFLVRWTADEPRESRRRSRSSLHAASLIEGGPFAESSRYLGDQLVSDPLPSEGLKPLSLASDGWLGRYYRGSKQHPPPNVLRRAEGGEPADGLTTVWRMLRGAHVAALPDLQ